MPRAKSRSRAQGGLSRTDSIDAHFPRALRSEITKVLEGFRDSASAKAFEDSCRKAREWLNKVIVGSGSISATPKDSILFVIGCLLSGRTLPSYSTLDYDHIREIQFVLGSVKRYQEDPSAKRPLNFVMLASPGAGKSHFIRCIAAKLGTQNIGAVTYNMVGLQRHEDLIPALDAARNFKVEDRLPLLFLDEFDVKEDHYPLLLPLLWDGQLTLGQHELKLGKVVIVLAGSHPHLPVAMEHARSMKPDIMPSDEHHPKLVDLLSRVNGGVLRIPQLSDPRHVEERRADKICMAVQLLRLRFGGSLKSVPLALLRFIALTEFRYGVRSIAHLIDLIPHSKGIFELTASSLSLPIRSQSTLRSSSLAYHLLSENQADGIVRTWEEACKNESQVPIGGDSTEIMIRYLEWGRDFGGSYIIDRLWEELHVRTRDIRRRR